jgi:pyridoxine/pyridoxamine 5'-phosphate oxidase
MITKAQKTLWKSAWKLLLEGQNTPKLPYGTPVVSTVSAMGIPYSRVLVLRGAAEEEGELICYTDRRSVKVSHLKQGSPFMSWTFWSPKHQLQFSCSGPTSELPEKRGQEIFLGLPKHARKAYAALSLPGTPLPEASDALPEDWTTRQLDQTNYAAENFLVLKTRITRAEVLHLSRTGNRRLLAERSSNGSWDFAWLVP